MLELCDASEDNPFIHGMSKQFVTALQQLFDVMDTDNVGTIRFEDLAVQWDEDEHDPYFPKGLITCLAKVTLPNGLLTFDRFCAGIKLCLLKNQVEINEAKVEETLANSNLEESRAESLISTSLILDRPPSEPKIFAPPPPESLAIHEPNDSTSSTANKNIPLLDSSSSSYTNSNMNITDDNSVKTKKLPLPSYEQVMAAKSKSLVKLPMEKLFNGQQASNSENDDFPKSQSFLSTQRANHLHQKRILEEKQLNLYENFNTFGLSNMSTRCMPDQYSHRAKSMSNLENLSSNCVSSHLDSLNNNNMNNNDFKCASSELEMTNGKHGNVETNKASSKNTSQPRTLSRNCIMKTLQNWRDNIMNKTQINEMPEITTKKMPTSLNSIKVSNGLIPKDNSLVVSSLKKNVIKRREPRRHTVGANGIDLYSIKRFQQHEQEKEILLLGLSEIDKTKDWYMRQISNLQDKINLAGRSGSFPSDCNIDAYQERINFLATRIQNLNQHLGTLRESAHIFPFHMNLAIRPMNGLPRQDPNQPKQLVVNPNLVNKLKEQNKLLTEEVSRKCERITQLEREKSSLIRELFQARTYSSYYNGDFDDTFM